MFHATRTCAPKQQRLPPCISFCRTTTTHRPDYRPFSSNTKKSRLKKPPAPAIEPPDEDLTNFREILSKKRAAIDPHAAFPELKSPAEKPQDVRELVEQFRDQFTGGRIPKDRLEPLPKITKPAGKVFIHPRDLEVISPQLFSWNLRYVR